MRKLKHYLLLGFLAAILYAAWVSWQAANYGMGPRVSSTALAGATREVAFVANSVDGSVSVLDLESRSVLSTIDVLPDGRRVGPFRDPIQWLAQPYVQGRAGLNFAQDTDLSRDGTVLFVSRGFLGDVAAFDIASGAMLWRTSVSGLRADHMDLSPDGKRLFVSALMFGGDRVQVLDSASGENVGEFTAGSWPHDVHVSPDGKRVYVASLGDMLAEPEDRGRDPDAYRVTVADARTLDIITYHDFEAGVRPFAVTRSGKRIYAQLSNTHQVVSYDTENRRLRGRLELPVEKGVTEADFDFEAPHHGLALTPDQATLCLAGRASDYAALVATTSFELLHRVPVGDAPSWAAIDRKGELCILPNTRSDNVSIVSVAQGKELVRIPVGRAPKHITVGRIPSALLQTSQR